MNVCCICGVKLDDPTKIMCDKCEIERHQSKTMLGMIKSPRMLTKEETASMFEKYLKGESND